MAPKRKVCRLQTPNSQTPKQFVYKTSRVGSQYQARIPRMLSRKEILKENKKKLEQAKRVRPPRLTLPFFPTRRPNPLLDVPLVDEPPDKLLWQPSKTDEKTVDKYLATIKSTPSRKNNEERVLYLLHQSDYDVDEALRRYRELPEPADPADRFDTEDRKKFEKFLCVFGKNFYEFKKSRCREKSVDEIVDYYYYWKTSPHYKNFITEYKGMRGWSRQKIAFYKVKVKPEVIDLE